MVSDEDISEFEERKIFKNKSGILYGIAINDVDFSVRIYKDGKTRTHPAYSVWVGMLNRCYGDQIKNKTTSYQGCYVCEEWLVFSNFLSWWKQNVIKGFCMDKDILFIDNKVYSPDTVIFVPHNINTFVVANNKKRGEYPVGVNFDKNAGKFRSSCRDNISGKLKYLGLYSTQEEAYVAWVTFKICQITEHKEYLDSIDTRLYDALINKIKSIL